VLLPRQRFKLARGTKDKEHAMSQKLNTATAVIGIDIGKNSFSSSYTIEKGPERG
jgi:transposase